MLGEIVHLLVTFSAFAFETPKKIFKKNIFVFFSQLFMTQFLNITKS